MFQKQICTVHDPFWMLPAKRCWEERTKSTHKIRRSPTSDRFNVQTRNQGCGLRECALTTAGETAPPERSIASLYLKSASVRAWYSVCTNFSPIDNTSQTSNSTNDLNSQSDMAAQSGTVQGDDMYSESELLEKVIEKAFIIPTKETLNIMKRNVIDSLLPSTESRAVFASSVGNGVRFPRESRRKISLGLDVRKMFSYRLHFTVQFASRSLL